MKSGVSCSACTLCLAQPSGHRADLRRGQCRSGARRGEWVSLIVLDHHQGVALGGELVQGVEQDAVVARVQPMVAHQHVAHALRLAAQLRGQANALRSPPERWARRGRASGSPGPLCSKRPGGCGFQAADRAQCRPRGLAVAPAAPRHPGAQRGHGQARHVGDLLPGKRTARRGVQPCSALAGAGRVAHVFHLGLGKAVAAACVGGAGGLVSTEIVRLLALRAGQLQACADAVRTPALLAVVGEQARLQRLVANGSTGAGAQRKTLARPRPRVGASCAMASARPSRSLIICTTPLPSCSASASLRSSASLSGRTSRLKTGSSMLFL